MLPHANLERLIGTALVDGEFRTALLSSPATAATEFGLTDEELGVLEAANASTLEELAGFVHAWISRAPQPRRNSPHRCALDGYQTVRVAV
jgi:hypothetical protein